LFFDCAYYAYRRQMNWMDFTNLVKGEANPLVGPDRMVTGEASKHPMFRALQDLEDRLGMQQGRLLQREGLDIESDPVGGSLASVTAAS
jgi:hypothetical protein